MRKQVGNNTYTDHIYTRSDRKGKDLGFTVYCNLSFEHHIMEKVSKANQMMRLIRDPLYTGIQNISQDCTKTDHI